MNSLPDKAFKAIAIRMLTERGKRIYEHIDNFIKKLENTKKNPSKLKNTITEMKDILEWINTRLGDTEEHISNLEDTIMEITLSEQQKEKQIKNKNKDSLRDFWDNIKHTDICIIGDPRKRREKL